MSIAPIRFDFVICGPLQSMAGRWGLVISLLVTKGIHSKGKSQFHSRHVRPVCELWSNDYLFATSWITYIVARYKRFAQEAKHPIEKWRMSLKADPIILSSITS